LEALVPAGVAGLDIVAQPRHAVGQKWELPSDVLDEIYDGT
jgi:hypothetical protein